ncbi:hypothetical protein Dimus_024535 [Dionaea muscipula]
MDENDPDCDCELEIAHDDSSFPPLLGAPELVGTGFPLEISNPQSPSCPNLADAPTISAEVCPSDFHFKLLPEILNPNLKSNLTIEFPEQPPSREDNPSTSDPGVDGNHDPPPFNNFKGQWSHLFADNRKPIEDFLLEKHVFLLRLEKSKTPASDLMSTALESTSQHHPDNELEPELIETQKDKEPSLIAVSSSDTSSLDPVSMHTHPEESYHAPPSPAHADPEHGTGKDCF